MKFIEAVGRDFLVEFSDTEAAKYLDIEVVAEKDATKHSERWPGEHKNVYAWWALANGKAIGCNENPARGLSYPVISYKGKK